MPEHPTAPPKPLPSSAAATGDGSLLARLDDRDPSALSELYDRHAGYVLAVSMRILQDREEAEEVTQDVFWLLWKQSFRYDPERGRFTTWLFAVARNRSLDRLRKRAAESRKRARSAEGVEPAAAENPERSTFEAERRSRVRAALDSLPEEQRRAVEMCFFQGLTHHEIAERLRHPLGTVKSRIRMAMEKLRSSLWSVS